MVTIK